MSPTMLPGQQTGAGHVVARRGPARLKAALLTLALAVTAATAAALPGASSPPAQAATSVPGPLHTSGSRILTANGRDYTVKSISWFGMETDACAPHGLWQIRLDDGLAEIRALGFNTIRLPYANQCLHASAVTSVDFAKNPNLKGKTPQQVMDIVIDRAAAHGLNVILDQHRPDTGAQSPLWYTSRYPEKVWIADWVMLAKRYAGSPTVIGVDLHNEPNGAACWGCGDRSRDWPAAATRAGDAVLAANPNLLVLVEGVENQQRAGSTWWGGGLADVGAHPVVLKVPHRVVYSPHDYPASIYAQSWLSGPTYPKNLPGQWDRTWGYLQRQNIAPVLLGEFGSKLQTTSDRQWMAALVGYLRANRMSFSYWSFNPNSGDTGGIVADDWTSPEKAKVKALAPLLGGAEAPAPTPTPTPTPAPTPTPTPAPSPTQTPTPTPSSTPSAGTLGGSWSLQSSWGSGYVAQLVVTAGTSGRSSWSVTWTDPSARSVVNAWGMSCAVVSGHVRCRGADWGTTVPAGGSLSVGVQLKSSGPAPKHPPLTFN